MPAERVGRHHLLTPHNGKPTASKLAMRTRATPTPEVFAASTEDSAKCDVTHCSLWYARHMHRPACSLGLLETSAHAPN